MSKIETIIDWNNGEHKAKLYGFLNSLSPKEYWISIKPYRKNRSIEANAYYWVGVVKEVCEFHGFNPDIKEHRDKVHEMLKKQFNSEEVIFKRKMFKISPSSELMERKEVTDYLDKKDWKPMIQDGCILLPMHVVGLMHDRNEYGQEVEIEDCEVLPKTTTKLDSVEHYEYLERIRDHYAIEHNFYIAPPKGSYSEFD